MGSQSEDEIYRAECAMLREENKALIWALIGLTKKGWDGSPYCACPTGWVCKVQDLSHSPECKATRAALVKAGVTL